MSSEQGMCAMGNEGAARVRDLRKANEVIDEFKQQEDYTLKFSACPAPGIEANFKSV